MYSILANNHPPPPALQDDIKTPDLNVSSAPKSLERFHHPRWNRLLQFVALDVLVTAGSMFAVHVAKAEARTTHGGKGTTGGSPRPEAVSHNLEVHGDLKVTGRLTVGDPPRNGTIVSGDTVIVYKNGEEFCRIAPDSTGKNPEVTMGNRSGEGAVYGSRGLVVYHEGKGSIDVGLSPKLGGPKFSPDTTTTTQAVFTQSGLSLLSCGQLTGTFRTEARLDPQGHNEVGITQLDLNATQTDSLGHVHTVPAIRAQVHAGHSPGNTGAAETFTSLRMLNPYGVYGSVDPAFEVFVVDPHGQHADNEPYLENGLNLCIFAKQQPAHVKFIDATSGDTTVVHMVLDGKDNKIESGKTVTRLPQRGSRKSGH